MNILVVVDMQNDFITGPLGTPEAVAIVPKVKEKIEEYRRRKDCVVFTRDTHEDNYLDTREGRHLPVKHCIRYDHGWEIVDELSLVRFEFTIDKPRFSWERWHRLFDQRDRIELVGVCTDICVIANTLAMQTLIPEIDITVDASCCAGTTPENHKAALQVMKSCQINVINE